jgi:hypothetical protein
MIDFARHAPRLDVYQSPDFQGNHRFLKRTLGESYRSQLELVAQYGLQVANPDTALQARMMAEHPQAAFMYSLLNAFSDHSDYVFGAMNNLWRRTGYSGIPYLYPIQELLDVSFGEDELNNPKLTARIDPQKAIAAIARYPRVPIVNLSWQFGRIDVSYQHTGLDINAVPTPTIIADTKRRRTLFYTQFSDSLQDSTPRETSVSATPVISRKTRKIVEPCYLAELNKQLEAYYLNNAPRILENPARVVVRGAYTPLSAADSTADLLTVVRAFPDKLFLVAGGNFCDDLTDVRATTPDWPSNLLIAAQWGQLARPHGDMYGADIYVRNNQLGLVHGSSLSTATLSAACSVLQHLGYSHPDIISLVRHYTDPTAYQAYIHNRFATINKQAVRYLAASVFAHSEFASDFHVSNKTRVCRRLD